MRMVHISGGVSQNLGYYVIDFCVEPHELREVRGIFGVVGDALRGSQLYLFELKWHLPKLNTPPRRNDYRITWQTLLRRRRDV